MSTKNSGGKIRIPLDHAEIEEIAARIAALLDSGGLSDSVFGRLVKLQADLSKADRSLSRVLYGRSLPVVDIRPLFWDDAFNGMTMCHFPGRTWVEILAGWVWRVAEYVERVEGVSADRMAA